MNIDFHRAIDQCRDTALAAGALASNSAECVMVEEQGLTFSICWVPALSDKDANKPIMPGGPRDPDFNPFLPPDPLLTVGKAGEDHNVVLNKFPVCDRHLVVARTTFEEQRLPLDIKDFRALAGIFSQCGGFGFYNGGTEAGASQRHKHVQWIPPAPGNPGLAYLAQGLPPALPEQSTVCHPAFAFRHVFVRTMSGVGVDPEQSAQSLLQAFQLACRTLQLEPDEHGLLPPCNMLADDGWMLLVPRRREHAYEVSVNAPSYGGVLYVRGPDHIESIRKAGPLAVLAEAAFPA
ncbi:ATP adenylyltransferase family protein [Allopusillimonas ginsengisoli]|uniref:ATP adenylyltransferase family protein n=1 Tax=Allopusillimonas ginsengisoli TaxID=453575 RepID=UPI0010C17C1C|nr:phosphorylase [Allopusillimonas ginsengisoli]